MSDSPADDTLDDLKADELEDGAHLAGNSDTGQSPSPFSPFRLALQRSIRRVVVLTVVLVPLPGLAQTPAKRGRGRPKGSKNKKSAAGTAASSSEVAPAAGEKRKRGRPPKVRSAELFPKCTSDLRDCAAQECPGGGCVG